MMDETDRFELVLEKNGIEVKLTIVGRDSWRNPMFIDVRHNGEFLLHDTFHLFQDTVDELIEQCKFDLIESE